MLRVHSLVSTLLIIVVLSQSGSGQQASTSENRLVGESDLKFVYVSDEKRLQLMSVKNLDDHNLLTRKKSALTAFAKSLIGIKTDVLVSPAPFRDKIACFIINQKIGKDEQKLVVVDTTGNNFVELGTYKIKAKLEKKPGTFASDPRNFVMVRNFKKPQWSPDGRKILVASLDGLYKVDVETRQSTRLGQSKDVKEAIWSLDGTEVYFTDGKDLFSINVDGSNEKKMPEPERHSKEKANLALSFNGSKLIFSNGFRLYALTLGNKAYMELFNCKTTIYAIEVVPTMDELVCCIGNVNSFELFVFDLQTMKKLKLKQWNASGADLVSPSVSPDGQSVLFSLRELHGNQQIHLADIGGNGIIKITEKDNNTYPRFLH